uniref:COS1.5 n=1 Tax=Phallusia mammillata TaxID=59560 RepID=A0A6F9DMZ7_9ASCI|nr:COS1.5 [Phallusia mammillata]
MDDAGLQSSPTHRLGDVVSQPNVTQGPDDVEPQPSFAQRAGDAEPQLMPNPGDIASQLSPPEVYGPMVPLPYTNPHVPVAVEDKNMVFNLRSEQAPQIGDTNIHTTGPVYNAPVYQKHNTYHLTLHQTYEQAHCSTQLPAPHYLDEKTLPKLPMTSPPPERAHCSSQLPASHCMGEETLPELTATSSSQTQYGQRECKQKLMMLLKQRVIGIASEQSSLADFLERAIRPVNLAIISKPHRIDDKFQAEGYHHREREFAKVFMKPKSDISAEELFPCAKEQAKEEVERTFKSDEVTAKQDYVEKHGNVVGVVGQAGIGKTTSAKKWAMQGLRGELFGETSFFFYIVIRHIDFSREMTLLQFLLSSMSIEWIYDHEEQDVLRAICNDSNVVIIFDGFDEAKFKSFSTDVPQPQLHLKSKAENYLKHLAGGNLLPRARKIFMSRPTQLYKLHPSYRPRFIVQILGLTPTSQDELGRQICGDRYDDIQQKLVENNNVFAYCYVPVNFILTLVYLMNYGGDIQFVSLTRVLAFTCCKYVTTDHLRGQEGELDKLAPLIYDAFLNSEIVLKATRLQRAGIEESTADAFTNMSVTTHGNLKLTILEGHKIRHFPHLIWQDFFVAFYLMMIMPLDEFENVHKELAGDEWEIVYKFVFGICDPLVFEQLQPLVSESSRNNWEQKKSMLLKFIQSKPKLSNIKEAL